MDDAADTDDKFHPFNRVPIEIAVCVGHARPKVRELLELKGEAVLPLDRRIEDPVELYIGDRLIAKGQLEEMEGSSDGRLAVRLTDVIDPGEWL